jgi:hypothetical protein
MRYRAPAAAVHRCGEVADTNAGYLYRPVCLEDSRAKVDVEIDAAWACRSGAELTIDVGDVGACDHSTQNLSGVHGASRNPKGRSEEARVSRPISSSCTC